MGTSDTEIPSPYGIIFNPNLNWKEKLFSIIASLFGFAGLEYTEIGSKECEEALSKVRSFMSSQNKFDAKTKLQNWARLYSSDIPPPGTLAESSGFIPFQKNILHDWNIVDENTILPDAVAAASDREGVKVLVRFPSSLLPDEIREKGTILEDTECLQVDFDKIDWRNFAPNVPILLQMHGGGMILGEADDVLLVEETRRLVQNASKSSPDLITLGIDYALAPENPFPVGLMDVLSVIDFLLKDNSNRKSIHLSGMSAGANLALVSGFEASRKFSGRISSIHAESPFLNPAADSLSYYMEQSVFPSPAILRFFWQAYLGFEKPNGETNDNDDVGEESELEKVLRKNSNYSAWKAWKVKYPSEALHRLVNPVLGIPSGLNDDEVENAPTIIVRFNRGDCLHEDGKSIVEALKPMTGKNAFFYEEMGLHCCFVGPYDPNNPQEYWKVWADAVFGSGEKNFK